MSTATQQFLIVSRMWEKKRESLFGCCPRFFEEHYFTHLWPLSLSLTHAQTLSLSLLPIFTFILTFPRTTRYHFTHTNTHTHIHTHILFQNHLSDVSYSSLLLIWFLLGWHKKTFMGPRMSFEIIIENIYS